MTLRSVCAAASHPDRLVLHVVVASVSHISELKATLAGLCTGSQLKFKTIDELEMESATWNSDDDALDESPAGGTHALSRFNILRLTPYLAPESLRRQRALSVLPS